MEKQVEKNQKQKTNEKYIFSYINRPNAQLRQWSKRHPKFMQHGKLEYFASFLCPVSTANVDVIERTRAEYDTIEFVILKLYSAGIRKKEILASMTGLDIDMVENILKLLEFTYHHISDGKLTPEGRESLNDGKNIQCFQTGKQVQFEAVTGTVLLPSMFQSLSAQDAYLYAKDQSGIIYVMPRHYIERDVRNDIIENFDKHRNRGTIHTNVEKILDVSVETCTHTEAFLVKYSFLPHPFILFPVQGSKNVMWMPVAVSESTAKVLEKKELKFNYLYYENNVRADSEFEALVELEKKYGLMVSESKLAEEFSIKDKTFRVVSEDTENAELRIHAETGFTPVFSVIVEEEKEEADDNVEM